MGGEISDGPINSFVNLVVTQIRVNPPRIINIQAITVMEVGRLFISFFLLCPTSAMYQVIGKALRRPLGRDYAADMAMVFKLTFSAEIMRQPWSPLSKMVLGDLATRV